MDRSQCFFFTLLISCLWFSKITAQDTLRHQKERIVDFDVLLTLDKQGVLTIEETIKVLAKGDMIKRGIFRKLPLLRKDRFDKEQNVSYKLKKVRHNNELATYRTTEDTDYLMIKIGRKNVFLPPGIHTYVITYTTDRQIGFFEEFDELYWNATGTEWDFAIDHVTAKILLPYPAKSLQESCYTGYEGSSSQNCTLNIKNDVLIFETSKLRARQGLTIATGFTKGVIKSPPPIKKPNPWIRNLALSKLIIPSLLYLCYFLGSWVFLGRRHLKPVIIPTFDIPEGISAATARYFTSNKLDNLGFVATLVRLHIQKHIHIAVQKKQYKITRKNTPYSSDLPPEEQDVLDTLFLPDNTPITLRKTYNRRVAKAKETLIHTVKTDTKSAHYFGTKWPFILIAILSSIGFFVYILSEAIGDGTLENVLVLCFSIFVTTFLSCIFFSIRMLGCFKVFLFLFFSIFYISIGTSAYAMSDFPMLLLPIIFFLIAAPWIYIKKLQVFTKLGHQKRIEVLGLRRYIAVAEQHRMDQLNDPEKNLAVFEQLLPYAIAFGLENQWADRFQNILDQLPAHSQHVDPILLHHNNLSSSMVNTVKTASYSTPRRSSSSGSSSSWSSGSSGGGSSGGGGGGGGGGGW